MRPPHVPAAQSRSRSRPLLLPGPLTAVHPAFRPREPCGPGVAYAELAAHYGALVDSARAVQSIAHSPKCAR